MLKEFVAFLKEYQVIGLAIAVIIGAKAADFVKAIVDHLIMPFVGLVVPGGDWRALNIHVGDTNFGIGFILGAGLDFLIVAALVFAFAKYVLKETTVAKK